LAHPFACPLQGKGLGRFLMQLLELVGRRSGVARLMLTVFHGNIGAVQLYRKLGWVACGAGTVG
jgi:GNAT superfamily N-acetyltransferase